MKPDRAEPAKPPGNIFRQDESDPRKWTVPPGQDRPAVGAQTGDGHRLGSSGATKPLPTGGPQRPGLNAGTMPSAPADTRPGRA